MTERVAGSFAFDRFVLDTQDRRLSADGAPVELNGRYFDALALLVRGHGRLVSKDRFLAEVWRGVPVTDEALTQCIKTLRRQLGDDAASPRFIETVPKHGYRFIAPIKVLDTVQRAAGPEADEAWHQFVLTGAAGTLGGAAAGLIGGLVYGFAAAPQPGVGASSVVMVLVWLTLLVGLVGAAGVSFGIATTAFARRDSWQWVTLAGAGGGLVIGAFGKLLGLDALTLLFGHSPAEITGAIEGLLIGAAVGAGAFLAARAGSIGRGAALAGLAGAVAGVIIDALDGRLMLGSLALLTHNFPGSRLRVDRIGRLFGETGFGPITQLASTVLEAALFSACVVGAMIFAQRKFRRRNA
jgi:DNA-binding winged helix-turn-helix (wHTH) protein